MGSAGGDWSTIWLLPEQLKDTHLSEGNHVEAAKEIFEGTGIVISTEGERYSGWSSWYFLIHSLVCKKKFGMLDE